MAQALLNDLASPEAELSILITDDVSITEINRDYFNRPWPTNVISFSMTEGEFADVNPEAKMLGDIVISMETAMRESDEAGLPVAERFAQLLVHGLLHIFGYDHETPESDAERMEIESERLMGVLGNGGLITLQV
jgi:probable rRNA maturation factor